MANDIVETKSNGALAEGEAQSVMEMVMTKGDLSRLTVPERNNYYLTVCRSLGLNPLTRPLEYLTLGGKMVMYARRDATDQLRKLNGVSIEIIEQKVDGKMFSVLVRAYDKSGRQDEDMGVVIMPSGAGEVQANAILKCITKAKRRVTLSICGLGFLDESEIEDAQVNAPKERSKVRIVTVGDKPQILPENQPLVGDDPTIDLIDGLTEWDGRLDDAAQHGTAALEAAWSDVPKDMQRTLKGALDRRHKPKAKEADKRQQEGLPLNG
jgi:hypothetical protein